MPQAADLDRLRAEYADRERRLAGSDLYSPFNPSNLFITQQRQRATVALLRRHGFSPLTGQRILEVGCGAGGGASGVHRLWCQPRMFARH